MHSGTKEGGMLTEIGENNLWETSLSFRYSLNQIIDGYELNMNKTFWMNTLLMLNITENWTMQHSARFDLIQRKMVFFHLVKQ